MRGVIMMFKQFLGGKSSRILSCSLLVTIAFMFSAVGVVYSADDTNLLETVRIDSQASTPTVLIQTQEPVGYRYTVYDSFDPVRVVVDFPGMSLGDVAEVIPVGTTPLQEIRVAKFDLSSGSLARVEILLEKSTEYQVSLEGGAFRVSFVQEDVVAAASPEPAKAVVEPSKETAVVIPPQMADVPAGQNASVLRQIEMLPGLAVVDANGSVEKFKYFTLNKPDRLVVDIYGVRPGFKQRSFAAENGMKQLRVGTYADKTRLVFDAEEKLPEHLVKKRDADLLVAWGDAVEKVAEITVDEKMETPVKEQVAVEKAPMNEAPAVVDKPVETQEEPVKVSAAEKSVKAPMVEMPVSGPVSVEAIDFINENGRSMIAVTLSAAGDVSQPVQDGDLVRFEISDASISRALRRTIDASAFPSAVTSVTPYTVTEGEVQNVRIAVSLKGPVPFALEKDGQKVQLVIEDGAYAEPEPPVVTQVEVEAPVPAAQDDGQTQMDDMSSKVAFEPGVGVLGKEAVVYTGEPISLVFDSADIRSILQLIGDVSGMNILASSDVKGTITLRLLDVPWDQALDLVLDTADLGKVEHGNIMRIMPKSKLREMETAEMEAAQEEVETGVLETQVFQISYQSVGDIQKLFKDMLTERGSVIPDSRNKQMIVKDVRPVLDEMEDLLVQVDKPDRQVMIEARIVEASTDFSRDLGVKWGFNYDNDAGSIGSSGLDDAALGLGGSFFLPLPSGGLASAGAAAGMSFGRIGVDTVTLDLRLSALESAGEGKIISTPRVTTINGQKASITDGTSIPYTAVSDDGTATKFENAELKLEVKPEINPDGSVILEVKATNNTVGDVVPQSTGGTALAIDKREAQTKVLVRDGDTTVIGGIFVETVRDDKDGVPLLMHLPVIGHLFRSTNKLRDRREVLIFITPRIVKS